MYFFTLVRPYYANYYIGLYSHIFSLVFQKGGVFKARLPLPFPVKFRLVCKRRENKLSLKYVFNIVYVFFFQLVVPQPLPEKQHY